MKHEKTPQEKAANAVIRSHAPVVGMRIMQDGEDIVVMLTVRKPSRTLLTYRVHRDASVEEPVSYKLGVNSGFKIRPLTTSYDAPVRSPEYTARTLPRFRDLSEAVRFLSDFPMIPTYTHALVHQTDSTAGKIGSLGSAIETDTAGKWDREGNQL